MHSLLLRIGLLTALGPSIGSAQTAGALLKPLLPATTVSAEILEPWSPPRFVALATRLQQAAQADPAWWRSHAQKAKAGEPLPYDARMGITEAEYKEMLVLADSLQMRPARTLQLHLESTPTGWRFPADGPVQALRGVEIDTTADMIRTPFGALGTHSILQASDAQKATGRWSGPQWKLEAVDPETVTGTVATFAVGRLEATGQTLIYFDARQAKRGQITDRSSVVIRIPRP